MKMSNEFDVIIVGGSYAGLSAAMSLGRALRRVLIIDSGTPCNRQTPHSHNFITHDGETPAEISRDAKEQVLKYPSVEFYEGLASGGRKTGKGFEIETRAGDSFTSRKLIFATGLRDIMPDIKGFAECWGISVIHCPYCHGYEVRNSRTGILANGDRAFHYAQLISNWTKDLFLLTNGKSSCTPEQREKMESKNIEIIEKEIESIENEDGQLREVVFKDASRISLNAIYSSPEFEQACDIPRSLGCELTEQGLIRVDPMQQTNIEGVFACGDNSAWRAISIAVSSGTMAGAAVNSKLIEEEF